MSDLVEFLRARLNEDEQASAHNVALDAEWAYESGDGSGYYPTFSGPTAKRVLAEVEVKRRIIDIHGLREEGPNEQWRYFYCTECEATEHPCPTLRMLAAPYSNHPGYNQEWKVSRVSRAKMAVEVTASRLAFDLYGRAALGRDAVIHIVEPDGSITTVEPDTTASSPDSPDAAATDPN